MEQYSSDCYSEAKKGGVKKMHGLNDDSSYNKVSAAGILKLFSYIFAVACLVSDRVRA